jgi:hypothetical protein
MNLLHSVASWYFKREVSRIETVTAQPVETQDAVFRYLTGQAKDTVFGKQFDFAGIQTIQDFKDRFPVQDYDTLKPWIEQVMNGEQNILWPSTITWFAKSSGTTSDKSKFIPVSKEALDTCHYQGGRDLLAMYLNNHPESRLFSGKGLVMGGSHQVNQLNEYSKYGDVSAVMMQNMPLFGQLVKTPKLSIALMSEWEEKIEKMAEHTVHQNVTHIAGVPTWTIVLIRRLFELKGTDNLRDIWPNLELYIHGGVSFRPYREQFSQLIRGEGMHYVETYNASEGFFAFQDRPGADDMLLMPDYGVFYEFIPTEEFDKENPKTLTWGEVETGKNYAVVISTNCGLWRYKLGDTVRFTSLFPHRIQISGRVKHFINAFGEEVIVDNSDQAIDAACHATGAVMKEYTAAPVYMTGESKGGHEWVIEFEKEPSDIHRFTEILDATLQSINSDYEAKRHKDMALVLPLIHVAPAGTFYEWMRSRGKLGGQHKVPRLSNDRKYLEEITALLSK